MIIITILIIAFVVFSVGIFFRPKWMGFPEQMNGTIKGRTSQVDNNRMGLGSGSEVPDIRTRCVEQYLASRVAGGAQSAAVPETLPWSFRVLIWFERSMPWIVGFILLFATMLFVSDLAHGDTIKIFPNNTPYTIGTGLSWNGVGATSVNNTYVFAPLFTNETACVSFFNNSSANSHGATVSFQATYDPANSSFVNPGPNVNPFGPGNATIQGGTIGAGLTATIGFRTSGAAYIAIIIAAGNGPGLPDTASIFLSQTNGGTDCAGASSTIFGGFQTSIVQGPTAPGTADTTSQPVQIGGIDVSGNVHKAATDTNGAFEVVGAVAGGANGFTARNPLGTGCFGGNFANTGKGGFIQCDTNGNVATTYRTQVAGTDDPCKAPNVIPQSVAINITSATTTSLVAVSGTTAVYVCGFDFTISEVVTTANTLLFTTGTGAACGGSAVVKTGLYGAGGVTAGIPIHIQSGGNGTIFQAAAASGVCATTAIGASGSFQGILTFVQQ